MRPTPCSSSPRRRRSRPSAFRSGATAPRGASPTWSASPATRAGAATTARPASRRTTASIGERLIPGHFAARAIAVDLVSTNARSFSQPPLYGQSLVADLIHLGVAGAAGHVDEPTLVAVARPALLLGAYARGVPAGEAFLRSIPYLGWVNVYIGDPLMRIAAPRRAVADRDGDGIEDARDNCLDLPNPDQRDTDADGFGNLCDPDLDGDLVVSSSEFRDDGRSDLQRIVRSQDTGLYVPDCDLDGDEKVDEADSQRAGLFAELPPGPSGRVPRR